MSGVVLYDKNCTWEIDYVVACLLKPLFQNEDISYSCHFLETVELLAYRKDQEDDKRILVFTSNLVTFEELKPLLLRFKPHVVIHLSDEWGTKPDFVQLSDFTKVVLRQHWFPQCYAPRTNIFPIPLGFMTKFPFASLIITPMNKRELVWSFVGTINKPRKDMLQMLYSNLPNVPQAVHAGGVPIGEVANIYNQSVFVPNERGAVRLDCFRLYEATLAGAIPVVVGSKNELEDTFVYDNDDEDDNKNDSQKPPWIFANTWQEAIQQCIELLADENRTKLQTLQTKNLVWFKTKMQTAQNRIFTALK